MIFIPSIFFYPSPHSSTFCTVPFSKTHCKTLFHCGDCNVNLCFSPDRDCFTKWHSTEGARVRAWVKENGRVHLSLLEFSLKDEMQVDLKSECFTPESRYFTFINIR
jgi:hypothetical protein